jgi:hypothetical protein
VSAELGDHAIDPGGPLVLVDAKLADQGGAHPVQLSGCGVDKPDCFVTVRDVAVPGGGLPGVPAVECVGGCRQVRPSFVQVQSFKRRSRQRVVELGRGAASASVMGGF